MTLASEIADRAEDICKHLSHHGLDTRPYLRGPVSTELFTTAIETRQIRLWPGIADVQVNGDHRRRQAVVNVTEGARAIEQTFVINTNRKRVNKDMVLSRFPVVIPDGKLTSWKVLRGGDFSTTVQASMQAPKSHNSFLMGFDEIRQFIALLPRRVTTVEQAHRALRPSGLSNRAVRQGEWFFDPATDEENAAIKRALAKRRHLVIVQSLEQGSSHTATLLTMDDKRFATGLVTDSRVKHHRPLVLDGWHRVLRNAEVQTITMPGVRRMTQRTWD